MDLAITLGIGGWLVLLAGALLFGVIAQFIGDVRTGYEWLVDFAAAALGALIASEFVISLRTTDLETAKARYPAELAKVTRLLATAQVTMKRPQAATERIARKMIERGDFEVSTPDRPLSDDEREMGWTMADAREVLKAEILTDVAANVTPANSAGCQR